MHNLNYNLNFNNNEEIWFVAYSINSFVEKVINFSNSESCHIMHNNWRYWLKQQNN